jgi:hypothetical protein
MNNFVQHIILGKDREERKVGDSSDVFLAVACTSEELNKFRIEYEKCHQKAVGMIEEQRPFDDNLSASRLVYY